MTILEQLGFAAFRAAFEEISQPELHPGRVSQGFGADHEVITETGVVRALGPKGASAPVVGDWVAYRKRDDRFVIEHVLPRQTLLARKAVGKTSKTQALVSNVDTVLIVTAAGGDFSPRRLERYLSLVWSSGATPVVVINKADTTDDVQALVTEAEAVSVPAACVAVSATTGQGMEDLLALLTPDQSIALVGSSGVGKSSLVNRLANAEVAETRSVRASDETGQHTTTTRCLRRLGDWVLIDTPGLREVGLGAAADGIDHAFADVMTAAEDCRFRNCSHEKEPGCAVRLAVESGTLDAMRLASYHELKAEEAATVERNTEHTRRAADRRFGKAIRAAKSKKKNQRGD